MGEDQVNQPLKVLTIAGSDSGGAAGMQADLRAWAVLGVYGLSVVTAVTAQNSLAVQSVQFMPPQLVAAQLTAVLSDYGAAAAKTGFLGRAEIVETVAQTLAAHAVPYLVVDPVLVNHQGKSMFPAAVAGAYRQHLLPQATILTPNRAEAELLAGMPVRGLADGETAVRRLAELGPPYVLLKRIPAGERVVDLLFDGQAVRRLAAPKIDTHHTHGAGDTLSAALCTFLAAGAGVETAVARARQFTRQALQHGAGWQMGGGHGPVFPRCTPWQPEE